MAEAAVKHKSPTRWGGITALPMGSGLQCSFFVLVLRPLEHIENIQRPCTAMPQVATAISSPEVRNRAALMEELRRLLPGVAEARKTLPFGLSALDSYLPNGGLACGALHEIVPEPRSIPATFGFIVAILARIDLFHAFPQGGKVVRKWQCAWAPLPGPAGL